MTDHEQQIIEAGMDYFEACQMGEIPNVDTFVAKFPAEMHLELKQHLEDILVFGEPLPFSELTPPEQAPNTPMDAWEAARFGAHWRASSHPLARLRQALELSRAGLAFQLNLPESLLASLEQGQIRRDTLPQRFIKRLAEIFNIAEAELRTLLTAMPMLGEWQLREDTTPYSDEEGPPVSFAEAFAAAEPTEPQRAAWEPFLS
jgi:transcriptional regulator with XRE-family HTH domain